MPTPITPEEEPNPALNPATPANNQPGIPEPKKSLPAKLSIAEIDVRTPEEEIEFRECEQCVGESWAKVGQALVRIRRKRLFKNEYASFEVYCLERWGFGRSKLSRYLAGQKSNRAWPHFRRFACRTAKPKFGRSLAYRPKWPSKSGCMP